MKYLKWFWFLLKAMILRKADIKVSFTKESNGRWYVDFPNWPLSHDNLEMVHRTQESTFCTHKRSILYCRNIS